MSDYIKREDAIDEITAWAEDSHISTYSERGQLTQDYLKLIRGIPSADVIPRDKKFSAYRDEAVAKKMADEIKDARTDAYRSGYIEGFRDAAEMSYNVLIKEKFHLKEDEE